MKIHEMQAKRAEVLDAFSALANKKGFDTATDQAEYDRLKGEVEKIDGQIKRAKEAQDLAAKTAQPAPGQETVDARPETDPYVKEKSLIIGGMVKMAAVGKSPFAAREAAKQIYGENHPVTKALLVSNPTGAGLLVPPQYMTEIIEMLRNTATVRSAGPRTIPMPRGTMHIPAQTSAASATYGVESAPIPVSQPGVGPLVATFKKMTALVPVSNDMMRYADPAVDAFVRDDLVKVAALREDLAFIMGGGSNNSPVGYLGFANAYAVAAGGSAGVFSTTANSTLAVGGNFITSNEAYTLQTVGAELAGAVNKLDMANVTERKRTWFMHSSRWNYLYNLQNSLGVYVYRDELDGGKLLGYPVKKTNQIGANYWDATGSSKSGSFIFLVEMTEDMVFDSMQLELAVSTEGAYVDASGQQQSAFQNDQTLIRAISEHDHLLRHNAAVSVIQNVQWQPANA